MMVSNSLEFVISPKGEYAPHLTRAYVCIVNYTSLYRFTVITTLIILGIESDITHDIRVPYIKHLSPASLDMFL